MPISNLYGTYVTWGPPGTGKTTWLASQVAKVAADAAIIRREAPITLCSLTRTAAQEIAGRDLPLSRSRVGTLHSHAYHALGKPEIAEVKISNWNEDYPDLRLSAGARDVDDDCGEPSAETLADALYSDYNLLRARQVERRRWPGEVLMFARKWEEWKKECGRIDFTDMIELALRDTSEAPEKSEIIIGDEAQDMSALEFALLRKWGEAAGALVLAGDPWQCQPPGTMVATPEGEIAIEDLDPARHRVISFDRRSSEVTGYRNPLRIKKASRHYMGPMFTIRIDQRETRCTGNHLWTVRIKRHTGNWHAVYLMRQGDNWRVGRCAAFRAPNGDAGAFGPVQRCRQEKGDAVWILGLYNSVGLAEAWQQIVSVRWQIPTTCFKDHGIGNRSSAVIKAIYQEVGHLSEPEACLRNFGRSIHCPFWINVHARDGHRTQDIGKRIPLTIHACNLLPEVMQIPVPLKLGTQFSIDAMGRKYISMAGKRFEWRDFTIESAPYNGLVYSLEVERHHHYIADGIITHNCLYVWRGAHPEIFRDPSIREDHKRLLSQSWRISKAVHGLAMGWARGLSDFTPIDYRPREEPGSVEVLPAATWRQPQAAIRAAAKDLEAGRSVMFQAACGYMVAPLVAQLKAAGIPFANPWRQRRGDWNPLARGKAGTGTIGRILAFLRLDAAAWGQERRRWTFKELALWLDLVQAKGLLLHGAKTQLEGLAESDPDHVVQYGDVLNLFTSESINTLWEMVQMAEIYAESPDMGSVTAPLLDWLQGAILPSKQPKTAYAMDLARKRGPQALQTPPRCYVGTINSFKGAEADSCYIFPDLSPSGCKEWMTRGDRDNVIRLFYVAFTRSRQNVTICAPANPRMSIPISGLLSRVMN